MPTPRFVMLGGFLGAGKTAAALQLASHLKKQGLRAGVITNDQGTNLVDTARVTAAGFSVEEITGGCFCCHFDRLLEASRRMALRDAPDVVIAEPVGSCTDLIATVGYPLRQKVGEEFALAPLSVLVDPFRCARILGLRGGSTFSEKVLYVYRKQLEEAELLVINKVDLLPTEDCAVLATALEKHNPRTKVFAVSCQTGEGLEEWFACLQAERLGSHPTMSVDYDLYWQGEALLGWLNATARVWAHESFDGNAWLLALGVKLCGTLGASGVEIGHLKMTLQADVGVDLAAVSVTGTEAKPHLTHMLAEPLTQGVLTVNMRAQADPEVLVGKVREALSVATLSLGGIPVMAVLGDLQAFRPARPNPTNRMEFPQTS